MVDSLYLRYKEPISSMQRAYIDDAKSHSNASFECLTLKNVESKTTFKMEKTEDFDLLYLQTLAQNQKLAKRQKTLEEKQMIIKSHLLNHVSISRLSREFGVSRKAIYKWISNFADGKMPAKRGEGTSNVKPNPSSMPKKSQKPVESEAEELARLREENKRLAEALKMAEWMNHAKDVMIDEAEKMFNIPIRKKAGAKQ